MYSRETSIGIGYIAFLERLTGQVLRCPVVGLYPPGSGSRKDIQSRIRVAILDVGNGYGRRGKYESYIYINSKKSI